MSFCLGWYYKLYEKLSGNSFKTLEKKVTQLESQEKLQNLLQGIGVGIIALYCTVFYCVALKKEYTNTDNHTYISVNLGKRCKNT